MRGGFRLGRVAGIDVHVDWSLLVIFVLISSSLALGVFPAWHPDWLPATRWATAFAAALLFFASVLIHELSHALVGRIFGVRIPRITLFIFGGIAQMEEEPRGWRAELWMAIAGPVTSIALGIGFIALAHVIAGPIEIDPEDITRTFAPLGAASTLLLWIGQVNLVLAVFNLVPGFPLDGGRVLRAIMWGITGDLRRATRWASAGGQAFAWLLIATGFAMVIGIRVPIFGSGLIGGLWLSFIGWFLNNAALVSYRQLLVRETLEHVPVERLMQTRFDTVTPDMPVSALVEEHLLRSGQRAFPVVVEERIVGIISLRDIRAIDRAAWATTPVRAIMTPVERIVSVSPRDDAMAVLPLLAQRDINQLPVIENGRVRGLVRQEDILKWLALYGERELGEQR